MPADILISIFAAVGFALTGIYVTFAHWHRPTWKAGVVLLFACAELTLARAFQGLSTDFVARVFWYKMCYLGFAIVPPAFFFLALRYAGLGHLFTRRVQFVLSIVFTFFVGLIFTNELHGWMWNPASTARIVNTMLFPPVTDIRLGYVLFMGLAYSLLGAGCFCAVRFAAQNRGVYVWQLYAIVLSTALAAIGCALDILGVSPLPSFASTALGLAAGIILIVMALAALRRRDALSISRDAVLNNITDGIIVVDGYDWIVDLNPAAEKFIGKAALVIGKPFAQIFPELSAVLAVHAPIGYEMAVVRKNVQLIFDLRVSAIRDQQGRVASQVIVLRDITERKRMEIELTAERESERKFSAQLTILAAVTNELSKAETLDEFCCRAVESGREKLGFDRLGLWLVSEDRTTMLGTYGTDQDGHTTDERQARHAVIANLDVQTIVEGRQALLYEENRPLYQNGALVGQGAHLIAGLWDGETVIGFLSADNLINRRPFSERDGEFLHLYASTLGHLYTLKRAQGALVALYGISQTLGSSLDPDEVLHTVVDSAILLTDAERGFLMLSDDAAGPLAFRLARNAQKETLAENLFEISRSVVDDVAATGQSVVTINAQDDPRFSGKGSVIKYALRSIMAVPLTVRGAITGVLYVDNKVKDALFSEQNLALLNTFAGQAAVAIENARLYEAVRQHVTKLEERVAERTAKLELANKELESFSYSVSHDLRAPLRAINGYLNMLVDENEASFDAESKRLFAVVQNEARRMGDLINGLLAISRVSYTEIHTTIPIDMARLASSVFEELTSAEDRQCIDFQITVLPRALGDAILVRQVWANLISNAIKFSSKRERPIIRITASQTDNEVVYSVSDNGVGFDMQYASKLFGVFQRLHSEQEFSGNGVGLATVQRIVQRHGGRVWAESEVGRGTVFCFSLRPERTD